MTLKRERANANHRAQAGKSGAGGGSKGAASGGEPIPARGYTRFEPTGGEASALTIYTIGHSTLPIAEFIGLLKENGVELLADVRTVPGSRHNPQYAQAALAASVEEAGISYRHLKGLGGLRGKAKESQSLGWRNASFRNFADYMQTPAFEEALRELQALAGKQMTALMCAEAVPWRCHRSLIADVLTARGANVIDIMVPGKTAPHRMTPFAKVEGGRVTYPKQEDDGPKD